MKLILKKAHSYAYIGSMVFFFFLLWPPLYYASLSPRRYPLMIRLRRIWAFLSSLFVGIIYRFEYEEPVDWTKTYIICPNHTSNLDTPMISLLLKKKYCFMGKESLLDNMVTAIYFRTVDIPVNRDNKMSAFRAFRAAAERLKNEISLVMFPEGGIADDYPPRLQEFKNGPFRLAIEQKVPVIPVSSANTWKIMWDDGFAHGSRPGVCKIFVHKPLETQFMDVADADDLRDEVYNIISRRIEKI